ncbi:MAG: CIA30 family protein [Saonia sp.]
MVIFDFSKSSDLSNWNVVDDVVMGGESSGSFIIDSSGNGVFKGFVSLANNGGFSLVRYRFKSVGTSEYKTFRIRIKGDGKKYQFRVKSKASNHYSYIGYISASVDWQIVEIPFNELYPSFRGRKLRQPNFSGNYMEEIGFLIGNKKAEDFQLEIDKIEII